MRQTQRINAAGVNEDMGNGDHDVNRTPASDRLAANEARSRPDETRMSASTEKLTGRVVCMVRIYDTNPTKESIWQIR